MIKERKDCKIYSRTKPGKRTFYKLGVDFGGLGSHVLYLVHLLVPVAKVLGIHLAKLVEHLQ
jgi:hypothetical protein